jgi:hypothetical protein
MENQMNPTQDCGCSDGCCTPREKSSPWKKWAFIAIILAAAAIITVKLVSDGSSAKCCEDTSCCP